MQVNLEVTTQDGKTHKLVASDVDILALEEQFDFDAPKLKDRPRMIWLAFLAWSVMHRKGITDQSWDTWKTSSFSEMGSPEQIEEGEPGNE